MIPDLPRTAQQEDHITAQREDSTDHNLYKAILIQPIILGFEGWVPMESGQAWKRLWLRDHVQGGVRRDWLANAVGVCYGITIR